MNITIRTDRDLTQDAIVTLYKANKWSASDKPELLYKALLNSHSLVTAWDTKRLIGLANAISDGYLVVYFPHMLVHPDYHRKGVGKLLYASLQEKYADFHMQMLTADGEAVKFYKSMGFSRAGNTVPMWIYGGDEH